MIQTETLPVRNPNDFSGCDYPTMFQTKHYWEAKSCEVAFSETGFLAKFPVDDNPVSQDLARVVLRYAICLPMNDQTSWHLTKRNGLWLLTVGRGTPLVTISSDT